MKEYEVTIGMPIYNVEQYIARSLTSALEQSFASIEYILVDDRGDDDSMRIVQNLIDHSFRKDDIRIIAHNKNLGPGAARNTIIEQAFGKYVYFLDNDDYLDVKAIELLYESISLQNDIDFVIGNFESVTSDDKRDRITKIESKELLIGSEAILRGHKTGLITGAEWNKLYKRDFLLNNSIINIHRIGEDHYWVLQEVVASQKVLCIPYVTYYYCLRDNSITNGYNKVFPLKLVNALYSNYFDCLLYVKKLSVNKQCVASIYLSRFLFSLPKQILRSDMKNKSDRIKRLYRDKCIFRYIKLNKPLAYQSTRMLFRVELFSHLLPLLFIPLYWRVVLMLETLYGKIKK